MGKSYEEFLEGKRVTFDPVGFEPGELNPMLFDWQKDVVRWACRKGRACLFEECGCGKGQPYGSKVLTVDGWKNIEDLVVGDEVFASDGNPYSVTGVYPKGEIDTYRFFYSDGSSLVFDKDHLHIVKTQNDKARGRDWRVMSTEELLGCGNLRYGKNGRSRNYVTPVVAPVNFEEREHILTPYVIGVLIGDGGLSGNSILLANPDNQVVKRVADELPDCCSVVQKDSMRDYEYRINTGRSSNKKSPVRVELKRLGLLGCHSYEKRIPREYLLDSIDHRVDLLRGLMDTDGHTIRDSLDMRVTGYEYCTTSAGLAEDVMELIQSLGGIPRLSSKIPTIDGVQYRKAWYVRFSLANINPCYLSRKADGHNASPRASGRWIDRIEYECKQKTVCISVDSPDHSYVTEGYFVTHNTIQQLEWANQVCENVAGGGRVLVVAPLAVSAQTVREGRKFGIDVNRCRDAGDVTRGINITNYERLDKFEGVRFDGVVLDESSILKSFTGKTRNQIIDMFRDVPYRLACTATPAPNDFMELGNHCEFCGAMSRNEMLAMFFTHDGGNTSKWRLKGHAVDQFWDFVSQWAVTVTKPSDLGYPDDGFDLPELNVRTVVIDSKEKNDEDRLFAVEALTLTDQQRARRDTIELKGDYIAQKVNSDDAQWLIWCDLNAESDYLAKSIPDAVEVRGSDTDTHKESALLGFADGSIRVLITKPSIAGYGMNWQGCSSIAFCGLSHSYEAMYQAIRRCWRYGQRNAVDVDIVVTDQETAVVSNVMSKREANDEMQEQMTRRSMRIRSDLTMTERDEMPYVEDDARGDGWHLMMGDCCQRIREIPDGSVGYTIFSPPFASLYTYSNSMLDLGNSSTDDEFSEHFGFLIPEIFRVTAPGRLVSFHCMNLPTTKERDGFIGIKDFRGDLIRAFEKAGFIYHSEVCIWKDPVTSMQRTKALGLLNKQKNKDSAMSRQGIPDYLVTMRKPGTNDVPITHTNEDFPIAMWQRYASPVWMDVNQSRTLQYRSARDNEDERHICPLQLDVIERGIDLWSAPGDTVLSPFMGIGSEGYVAVKKGRRFVGIELKPSYFNAAVNNIKQAEREASELTIFDFLKVDNCKDAPCPA